jgi:uncharacterized membrane protein YraQ (UPF0718 family)
MKKLLMRYKFPIALFIGLIIIFFVKPDLGHGMVSNLKGNLREMLSVLPPIFVLLGLLDVWIEKETMMKYMGDNSGILGSLLIFIMGSAAAGPLYAAFPIAAILLKKGVKLFNIFLFLGVWSTAKIPMLLFETANLGIKYMAIRLICNIFGIIIIALLLNKTTTKEERNNIYGNAKKM